MSFNAVSNSTIGRNLFKLRWENYWSQNDLSQKLQVLGLDIDKSTILCIEKGRRKLLAYEIPYFAKVFNMELEDFIKRLFANN